MSKKIIWSPLADKDFASILEYLDKNWGKEVAVYFIDLTETILNQISINPRQFPVCFREKRIRKCVLTKHNTLYYRSARSRVEILRIYDTRQDPDTLTFK
jgi:plasmid stabilization system protein ParE